MIYFRAKIYIYAVIENPGDIPESISQILK